MNPRNQLHGRGMGYQPHSTSAHPSESFSRFQKRGRSWSSGRLQRYSVVVSIKKDLTVMVVTTSSETSNCAMVVSLLSSSQQLITPVLVLKLIADVKHVGEEGPAGPVKMQINIRYDKGSKKNGSVR